MLLLLILLMIDHHFRLKRAILCLLHQLDLLKLGFVLQALLTILVKPIKEKGLVYVVD